MLSALPLQAILQFKPPSRESAIPHLTSLCDKLGLERDEAYVAELYDRNVIQRPPVFSAPGPPNGNEWLPAFDLRRAITQLQLERGVPIPNTHGSDDDLKDLASATKRAEVISYTDAHLGQRPWATMEVSPLDADVADQLDVRSRPIPANIGRSARGENAPQARVAGSYTHSTGVRSHHRDIRLPA